MSFRKKYNLSEHLIHFLRYARSRGLPVGVGEALSALRALQAVPVTDPLVFREALRVTLVKSAAFAQLFDELFEHYWQQVLQSSSEQQQTKTSLALLDIRKWGEGKHQTVEETQQQTLYSPYAALGRQEIAALDPATVARLLPVAYQLGRSFAVRLRRRYTEQSRSGVLAFRQTIRKSLRYGGLPLELQFRQRERQKPRFVFVCDVSRSMERFARFFLHFLYAAVQSLPATEVFVFSTELQRLTPWMHRSAPEQFHRILPEIFPEHGGGTRIGTAFEQFRLEYAALLSANTHLIVVSDGLDFGETTLLQAAMRRIAQRVRSIWWLYPLPVRNQQQPQTTALAAVRQWLAGEATVYNIESLERFIHRFVRKGTSG